MTKHAKQQLIILKLDVKLFCMEFQDKINIDRNNLIIHKRKEWVHSAGPACPFLENNDI